MDKHETEVLIIGGGPTGLTAALLLARYGVKTTLVESRSDTSIHPRARGLNVRTMEILRSLGLEEAVLKAGQALAKSRYMLFVESLAGREIRRVPDDELVAGGELLARYSPCDFSQCAQNDLEPLLAEAARQNGAELRFGTRLVAFNQDENSVTATLQDGVSGPLYPIRARYMIAADGAKSMVRESLGIPMSGVSAAQGAGRGPLGYFVNIYFRADLSELVQDRWFGICFIENPQLDGLMLAVNNTDLWLLNVSYSPDDGTRAEDFTPERCSELIRIAVGQMDLEAEIVSVLPWEAAAQIADRLQEKQVFLAGDAAHQMPPAGGFGLNTGVQDAHNLAWKLAAVLQEQAEPSLLQTYQAERWPVAETVVNQAVRDLLAPTPDTLVGPPEWEGNGGEDEGGPDWGGGDLTDQLAVVLGYRYESSAIIAENNDEPEHGLNLSGQPGTRAPHIWLEQHGRRISSLDLFGQSWVLLTSINAPEWAEAATVIQKRLKLNLQVWRIGEGGDLTDLENRWPNSYGIGTSGAVLVRPDGFVAWRVSQTPTEPQHNLEQVLNKLLGR